MRFWIPLFLSISASAVAADTCNDENLVLDIHTVWDFRADFTHNISLPTHKEEQVYPTKVVLNLAYGVQSEKMGANYQFQSPPNQVGLAYNIYHLQIQIGDDDEPDRQFIDQDYTADCTGPGASLWPGEQLNLKPFNISPHADGSVRSVEPVHLRFWGK